MHKAKVIQVGSYFDKVEKPSVSNVQNDNCYIYSGSSDKNNNDNVKPEKKDYNYELQALSILQDSRDENISKAASLEIANRIQWKTTPSPFVDFVIYLLAYLIDNLE